LGLLALVFVAIVFSTPKTSRAEPPASWSIGGQLGPSWGTCKSNECGIEFGSEPGISGTVYGLWWIPVAKDWELGFGPAATFEAIPLHGRNGQDGGDPSQQRTADGDWLLSPQAEARARAAYRDFEWGSPFAEIGGGFALMTTTFADDTAVAPVGRAALGVEVLLTDQLIGEAFVGFRATGPYIISGHESDGLRGPYGGFGLQWRFNGSVYQ
jgi:hypothetical protein